MPAKWWSCEYVGNETVWENAWRVKLFFFHNRREIKNFLKKITFNRTDDADVLTIYIILYLRRRLRTQKRAGKTIFFVTCPGYRGKGDLVKRGIAVQGTALVDFVHDEIKFCCFYDFTLFTVQIKKICNYTLKRSYLSYCKTRIRYNRIQSGK